MSSIIHCTNVKPTPSGKALLIKSGDKTYFAKKDSGIEEGMVIEAETKASEYDGKTNIWVEKWKRAGNGSAGPAPASAPAQDSGVNMAFMPFVSNVVAHAIQAGKIEQPSDIARWANGAYSTALGLKDIAF